MTDTGLVDGRGQKRLATHDVDLGIVCDANFILATRDSGYKSTTAAIAELVDNSLQAAASEIDILILPEPDRSLRQGAIVAVLDDGRGMDEQSMHRSLQFGGSSRFGDRSGIGRFGMGLPNSSVSQSRRVELYSWQNWADVKYTYLDVDEIASGQGSGIPRPLRRCLPNWAQEIASPTGTLAVWSRCDRLDCRRVKTLENRLQAYLGRTYRKRIWTDLSLRINGNPVSAIDPLFCHPTTGAGGATPFGPNLRYEIRNLAGTTCHEVVIRFTELPIRAWSALPSEEKRARGIVGLAGASFMRADREIDHAWCLFGAKRKENYDDWWRCEISFPPDLDELFGVNHSKQCVNPNTQLRAALERDLEAVARDLNARVRRGFEGVEPRETSRIAVSVTNADLLLPRQGQLYSRTKGLGRLKYDFVAEQLDSSKLFEVTRKANLIKVVVNRNHPFFACVYARAKVGDVKVLAGIEYLLIAAARAELELAQPALRSAVEAYKECWSMSLAAFLDRN